MKITIPTEQLGVVFTMIFEIRNNFQNKQNEHVQGVTQTLCLNGVVMALDYFQVETIE